MKFVAVTACPTGIAHTYMAAELLQRACEKPELNARWKLRVAWCGKSDYRRRH